MIKHSDMQRAKTHYEIKRDEFFGEIMDELELEVNIKEGYESMSVVIISNKEIPIEKLSQLKNRDLYLVRIWDDSGYSFKYVFKPHWAIRGEKILC